jgi:altronate hydrolase
LTAEGGMALLTEVPEMFGAETILMNRAENEEVFGKVVELVNDFKQYFIRHGQEIYENPSPGNKAGGITTLEEKSLGCTQKGGNASVTDVLPYGVRATKPGLNLIQGPGNDLVSVTALAAAGAHIVLFTTGRGTPFGGPVPTVKLSTNSELARKKKHWIDFDAGKLLDGTGMDELAQELLDYVVALSSGVERTNGEQNGFREIAIFKDGVIL